MRSPGKVTFDGFYGSYHYELRSGSRECSGEIHLSATDGSQQVGIYAPREGQQLYSIKCNWKGHVHVPVWATPAVIAFLFVGCLLGCYRKQQEQQQFSGHRRQQGQKATKTSNSGTRQVIKEPKPARIIMHA